MVNRGARRQFGEGAPAERPAGPPTIEALSLDELRGRAARAVLLIDELEQLLPGATAAVGRRPSGVQRREEESSTLLTAIEEGELLGAATVGDEAGAPPLFARLLRDRVARSAILNRLVSRLEPLVGRLGDSAIHVGERSRPVVLAAFEIGRSVARQSAAVRPVDEIRFQPASAAKRSRAGRAKRSAATGKRLR